MNTREGQIKLREATIEDLEVLRFWDQQPHVHNSDPDEDWHWEIELLRKPAWRELLIAELDGTPVGFIQIIDPATEDTHYWGDVPDHLRAIDIWIGDAENLGKGYGSTMMCQALERCFSDENVNAILIDPLASNVRAHRFYEKMGFVFIEERTFGDDECLVYRLERKDFTKF